MKSYKSRWRRRQYGFTAKAEDEKLAKRVRSSAGAVVFVGAGDQPKQWVDVGRAYQRFGVATRSRGV